MTCNGLGAGSAYSKEVPTLQLYPHMSTQGVQITISLKAYERLVSWASMGRTLNSVLQVLLDVDEKDILPKDLSDRLNDAYEELNMVRDALDECHQAVRRHWGTLP